MSVLKLDGHFLRIRRHLLGDEASSDIIFRTKKDSFFSHSHLLLPHIEFLSSLMCDSCRYSHEKIVIILPDVESKFIEEGLVEFYSKGDLTKLNLLFDVQVVKNSFGESKDLGSTEDSSTDIPTKENTKATLEPHLQQIELKVENDLECNETHETEELTFAAVNHLDVKIEHDAFIDEKVSKQRSEMFICDICDKVCQRKENLTTHKKQKHGVQKLDTNIGSRFCSLCQLRIKRRDIWTHVQEKHPGSALNFQCEQCDKKFRFKSKLESHLRQHFPKTEQLFCQTCDFQTGSEDSLRRHIQRHATIIKCDKCEYVSNRLDNFERHNKNKHGDRKVTDFECDICEKYLPSTNAIKLHKKRNHLLIA